MDEKVASNWAHTTLLVTWEMVATKRWKQRGVV
jgi:hypothetical protein